jgi:hypothetical protein
MTTPLGLWVFAAVCLFAGALFFFFFGVVIWATETWGTHTSAVNKPSIRHTARYFAQVVLFMRN